ncbi:DUF3631 domain-containing protein [Aldersonia sp. NBC_00410]|uniref:DUF3631 domain-containing protein n=1 Tax=Aldersonia sp. NBC_00410 TaxID=2975954 RepID=UPI002254E590|nr:DUF3631 domain-containing protein [Aldersonia sp. NBC_00410]MCX5044036.1 DUF3631 domain-containing protein [Aldersonia sp. NBC_00410]
MNADAMPVCDSLAREIEYLIRAGATHVDAPNIGSDVLDVIDAFVARFLALPSEQARHTLVLWCAHTWLMDCWEHTPRLLFTSPEAGCGKTRALTVTKHLVPRPDHVADLTPAALYHSIDEALELKGGRPTVLFDEFDTVFGTAEEGKIRNEDMRRLINAGHDRSETVARKMGQKTKRFQVYSPVALAGKMAVDDVPATIRTRSIAIPMQRRRPEDNIERWNRHTSAAEAEPLRWLLQCWAELVHSHAIEFVGLDRPVLPKGIEDRDADVWEPLLAVAELAGGHWPEPARVTAVTAVTAAGVNAMPSEGMQLLWEIQAIFDRLRIGHISSRQLVKELDDTGEFGWSKLPAQRAGIKMAKILKGYGVGPVSFRDGTKTFKGYQRYSFADAWLRYPPPSGDNGDNGDNGGGRR